MYKKSVELLEASQSLLNLAKASEDKRVRMLKYNNEVAVPNGFKEHSDVEIEFQQKVTERILNSYRKTLNLLIELSK